MSNVISLVGGHKEMSTVNKNRLAPVYQYIQDKGYANRQGNVDKIAKWTKYAMEIWLEQHNKFWWL